MSLLLKNKNIVAPTIDIGRFWSSQMCLDRETTQIITPTNKKYFGLTEIYVYLHGSLFDYPENSAADGYSDFCNEVEKYIETVNPL